MELKKTKERPTSGQFIAVWEDNGKPWCETQKVDEGELYIYDNPSGWINIPIESEEGLDISYFVPLKREKFEVHDANGKYYESTNSKEEAVLSARAIKGTVLRFVEDGNVNF
jgi:hypothetical protein